MPTENPLAAGIDQIAHVTNSLDRAIREFRQAFGIAKFLEMRNHSVVTREGRRANMHVALAYRKDVMIELIEPIGGDDLVYREGLDGSDFVVRQHHVARIVDSDQEFDEEFERLRARGVKFPIMASRQDTNDKCRVFYADLRPYIGYYIEYLAFSASGRQWLDTIPGN
jgi:hypothetical protein